MSDANEHPDFALQSTDRGLFLAGSRALLYSHVAVEMLRKQLVHQLGEDLARAIVAQAGRHAGFNDAQLLLQERSFDGIEDMLRMQYKLLTASGFGQFELAALDVDPTSGEVYVRVRCAQSPEAEGYRRLFGASAQPACWHLVGYSTGWTSAMTSRRLLTVESRCVARGDEHCELETLAYDDFIGPEAAFWKRSFESTSTSLAQELEQQLATIQRQVDTIQAQQRAIAALSAPVLQVASDLLVLPLIGAIDSARARAITEKLLPEVIRRSARGVILDVTGVEAVDAATANHLMRVAHSVRLLGAELVLTGVSFAVADVLVSEGIDLPDVVTRHSLEDGLRYFQPAARRRR